MKSTYVPVRDRVAQLIRTRKYIAVICHERWGSSFFSRTGPSTFISRKFATSEWIGENIRKALYASEDFLIAYGGYPLPANELTEATKECAYKCHAFWLKMAEEFSFKDTKAAKSKSALVFIHWNSDKTDQIKLLASRGSGTSHSAWYEGENEGKVFHVSINASDEEMGEVAVRALDACRPNYA